MFDDEKLVELLVKRDDLLEQGLDASAEKVCKDCPELAEEFKARLQSLKRTDWLFATDDGEQQASPPPPSVTIVDSELPPSSLTVEEFHRAVVNSGLMTAEEIQALQQSISADMSSDTRLLARELVRRKKLTLYQASVLVAERSDPLLLDRYVILDAIDSGGMGLVFKALHRSLDRVVALKTLRPEAVNSEEKVKRFQREAKTAASLTHPNIVTTHDAHESNGVHFLVMEYVKGSDLNKVIKASGPLSVKMAVNYVIQAAKGLQYAHAKGIVHRDVKPSNLLLDADGTVKVLDLGLARLKTSHGVPAENEDELTAADGVMGTVAYMSPEQAADSHEADARSDVYSLGCTLCFLLTGRPPYREDTLVNNITSHRDKPIPPLSEWRDDVPEDVIAVYRRMLAKKPEDRFQSMAEVIAALIACGVAGEEPIAGVSPSYFRDSDDAGETVARKFQPAKRRSWWWAAAAVVVLVLLVQFLTSVVFKSQTPEIANLSADAPPLAVATFDAVTAPNAPPWTAGPGPSRSSLNCLSPILGHSARPYRLTD